MRCRIRAGRGIGAHGLLKPFAPTLGRPCVNTLKGSRHANVKEPRFTAADSVWRTAFAFDPKRQAILLVGGDKSSGNEKRFYQQLIRKADARLDEHIARFGNKGDRVMAKILEQKMPSLSAVRRRKVKARTIELVAEERSRRDLRCALTQTQEQVAEDLGIGQEGVSRLEKRSDLLISTSRGYVEALGGSLRLVAEFPNQPRVILSGLTAVAGRIAQEG